LGELVAPDRQLIFTSRLTSKSRFVGTQKLRPIETLPITNKICNIIMQLIYITEVTYEKSKKFNI
jgi:hypothetical protein